jgi:hypothetical protein
MSRWWTVLPLAVMAAVPIWTAPSAATLAIETVACLLCAFGVSRSMTGPATAGSVIAVIGYAVALWLAGQGIDVIGAALFGTAVLFLLDLHEFARRFRGADITNEVLRAQTAYWPGRAAIIAVAVAALAAAGFVLSLLVPGAGRAVVAGLGAVLAFAGALNAGIVRRPGDT